MPDYILQVTELTKSYSGIKALDNVRLSLRAGEIHALMGENGAGKSTFMKILVGLVSPDIGEIIFEGSSLKGNGVNEIQKRGISMIHQEILIIPELTVAQNIFLGREKQVSGFRSGWLNDKKINRDARGILDQMGLSIPVDVKMKYLSVAEMQMVEIAKAISNDAKVIIMDEPTSAISDKEVTTLFRIIRELKAKGVAIIYISHKMDEIFEISDTITVLRDGKYIATHPVSDLNKDSLIAMMVGREIRTMFPDPVLKKGEQVLSVKNLGRKGSFSGVSFEVHKGEIMGISGLMGAGRTEIARTIFGLDRPDTGEVVMHGKVLEIQSPHEALKAGIGYVSEDRKGLGFVPELSVLQNMTLSSLANHKKGIFINVDSEENTADKMISNLKIKASGFNQKVSHLSGGNQQKVVIGKVLLASPEVIILDEPTRGVDVGAKFEIYKLISNLAANGMAVIMISSELPEILGMSDRIIVLSKGKQTAQFSRSEATQELIMKHALQ